MDKNDYDYFVESVSEQLVLMFWTAFGTLVGVGVILAIALQCSDSEHSTRIERRKEMPKYDIEVQLSGNDGNAFAVMAQVTKALRRAGATPDELSQYQQESMSGDYNNLLRVANEWVEVA